MKKIYRLIIGARNALLKNLYKLAGKPVFFLLDPEAVHDGVSRLGKILGRFRVTRALTRLLFGFSDPSLGQTVAGIKISNPVGLAAGFDKDAKLINIIPSVGFGFMDVGSVTGEPCAGNPKPRLWRLKRSGGLVVYYGLKNRGCEIISKELRGKRTMVPLGISVAMTNSEKNLILDSAIEDYAKAFSSFADIGDYITVNVSCPNACGGQPFSDPANLERLLSRLDGIRTSRPVFLKLSPDLEDSVFDETVEIACRHRVAGIICSNLTKKRGAGISPMDPVPKKGGVSGKPVRDLSDRMIERAYRAARGRLIIIGCGGVFSAEDAYRKIRKGASLIQMVTGMIFEGPQVVGSINLGIAKLLERDGFSSINEAIGADFRQQEIL